MYLHFADFFFNFLFLLKVVQDAHRVEEIVISSYKAMKEEEGRHIFELIEKKSEDLNANLVEADWDKKSAKATLDVVERQVEAQHK